jgi:hypothetical protein
VVEILHLHVVWNKDGKLESECCGFLESLKYPCIHMVCAFGKVKSENSAMSQFWSMFDLRLYGDIWKTSTWAKQYAAIPLPMMSVANIVIFVCWSLEFV